MSLEHTLANDEHMVLPARGGSHLHFLNHAATIKVPSQGARSMSVVEFTAREGFGPPLHNHVDEDEMFVVLDGALAFLTGDDRIEAESGAMAYLPHGRPHGFQVLSPTARFVCITASNSTVPRFDEMVTALGVPTDAPTVPEPAYIDAAEVAEVTARFGIDIVGPPPAPLTDAVQT